MNSTPFRIRSTNLILILSVSVFALTACSARPAASDFDPAQSGIYVTSEKTVTSAAVEKLENDYYDEAELQSEVSNDLADFNTSMNTENPSASPQDPSQATLKSCTVTAGEAKLLIDFQTPESYVRYTEQYGDEDGTNRITWLDVTDTTGALAKGYFSEVSLIKPAGDTKTVPPETVAKENLTVIAVKGAGPVQTEGKIRYVSNNVKVTGSTAAQTPEDGISVIVFQ